MESAKAIRARRDKLPATAKPINQNKVTSAQCREVGAGLAAGFLVAGMKAFGV
jgi:hypothetical protein